MDVLYLIKEDHNKIRSLCNAMMDAFERVKALKEEDYTPALLSLGREVRAHLHLEETYLFPEVLNVFPDAKRLITTCLGHQVAILKALDDIEVKLLKIGAKKLPEAAPGIANFKAAIEQHFSIEEEMLLPKIRQLIPTQDREDLGQVFQDVREEIEHLGIKPINTAISAAKTKTKVSVAASARRG